MPRLAVIAQAMFMRFVLVIVWLTATGCGDAAALRPGDIRAYSVARAGAATGSPHATARMPEPPDRGPRVLYSVPDGWVDRDAGGLRLATLAIGDPINGHDVTVIPASGTLESNVSRWQGQLEPGQEAGGAAEAVAAAIAGAEVVEAAGLRATVVLLLDDAAQSLTDQQAAPTRDPDSDAAGEAILAAMLPLPGEPEGGGALFVKFKGPAAIARRERERFVRFVASLRLEQPDAVGSGRSASRPDEE